MMYESCKLVLSAEEEDEESESLSCRVCLQVQDPMVHIFAEMEGLRSDLASLLEECGGLRVTREDVYPKYLCKECTAELLVVVRFREKCKQTRQVMDQIAERWTFPDEIKDGNSVPKAVDSEDHTMEEVCVDVLQLHDTESTSDDSVSQRKHQKSVSEITHEHITPLRVDTKYNNAIDVIQFGIDDTVTFDSDSNGDWNLTSLPAQHMQDTQIILQSEIQTKMHRKEQNLAAATAINSQSTYSHVCYACGAFFLHSFNLKRHLEKVHQVLKFFSCDKCKNFFASAKICEEHAVSCTRTPPKVTLKGKVNKIKRNLPVDNRMCDICGKVMQSNSALQMHKRTHTGERPFPCEHCPKAFKTQSALSLHLKRHSNTPDYECEICHKPFYETSNLNAHMRTHTNERPHKCSICSKAFTRVFLLQLHMRTHTGERPYPCPVCKRAFTQQCDLKNHMYLHTGERKLKCSLCPKTFIKRTALLKHMERHSGWCNLVDRNSSRAEVVSSICVEENDPSVSDTKTIESDFYLNDFMEEKPQQTF